jgi:tetratricopeptide (TPR) repeat protein
MKTTLNISLDTEELLHLAWAASDKGNADQAISLLKQAVDGDPGNAKCRYLLGAEYAQIGMFDRAAEQMGAALTLDPSLHAARFQLGLLQLTSRQPEAARATWSGLDILGERHAYVLFKTGLLHLARDEFGDCLRCLHEGIALNDFNAPLNADMQRVIEQTEPLAQDGDKTAAATDEGQQSAGHLFINAYTRRLN